MLGLFEQARWEALAAGPGMDLYARLGVTPVVRKQTVEYLASTFPGDVLQFETDLSHVGRTSFTMHQAARKKSDGALAATLDIVFVCLDESGQPTAVPRELTSFYGVRPSIAGGRSRHHEVEGVSIGYDVVGDGPPILLVHGFPFDRTMWRHQVGNLSGRKRIAPDLRGMGLSDPGEHWSMGHYASDLLGLLDVLGVEKTVFCGLSMGGYIAFEFWRRYPERVSALVLANTRAAADSEAVRRNRNDAIAKVELGETSAVIDGLMPKLLAPDSETVMPRVREHLRTMMESVSPQGMIGALAAMRDRPDSTDTLSSITVPTLVIAGSDDQIIPVDEARSMAQQIPGAQFTVIPEAGHIAPLEQPIATNRVLGEFLDSIR